MINIEKIKTISSFLAENVNDLYVTKLMKLFYYIDFISYAERGAPVTNDTYYKLPYGPVPSFIKNEIDNLMLLSTPNSESFKSQLSGSVKLEAKEAGKTKGYVIKPVAQTYDKESLSSYEWKLLERVFNKFKNKSAKELTEQTHKEAPYLQTPDNSPIDYSLAEELDVAKIL